MSPRLAVSVPSHYKDRGQKNKRKKGDFMKYYILTENRHNQILLFDSFDDAFNWCKSATRWTDAEIKANIKTAQKMGSHYSIFA